MLDDLSIELLSRVRQGDERAAGELFERYVERLLQLARSRLSSKLQARVDPEDVIQSVYRTFFVHAQGGRYELQVSGDLWRLLAAITVNKVRNQVRHGTARKRAVDVEQRLAGGPITLGVPPEVICRAPSPEELNVLLEELESEMLLLSLRKRRIVELRLQGHSNDEIATQIPCTERTVQRTLQQLKSRLEQRLLQDQSMPPTPDA